LGKDLQGRDSEGRSCLGAESKKEGSDDLWVDPGS
jgi:hypothetical protein